MRALCVFQGAPQPLQKELGPLGTGTGRTVRYKLDALGFYCLFLLAMHPAGRVKTRALLTDGCRRVVLCQRRGHI